MRGEIEALLQYILGHFAANPSRPGTVEALKAIYTFPTKPTFSGLDLDVASPNTNEAVAKDYLERIAHAAHRARLLYCAQKGIAVGQPTDVSTEKFAHTKYLLLGEKGSGKTIFINYLLTAQHHILNRRRVIWVRCDYTKDVPENVTVEARLRWQMCRVLALYYDAARFRLDKATADQNPQYRETLLNHWREKSDARLIFEINGQNEQLFRAWCKITESKNRIGLGRTTHQ